MKILHINCSDRGSTGKIVADISSYADKCGNESFLCTPHVTSESAIIKKKKVCVRYEQGVYRRISSVLGLRYGFAPIPTAKILRYIKKIKPDVVHLHSINCSMVNIYKLLEFLKKNDIPTVVTNHAEFFYTGSCSHAYECDKWMTGCGSCADFKKQAASRFFDRTATAWSKMKTAFEGFKRIKIVSVSPWVMERSEKSPIMDGIDQCTVQNGLNIEVFSAVDGQEIRNKYNIKDNEKILLCVAAFFSPCLHDNVKGSEYLVDIARRVQPYNIRVLVIGPYSTLPEDLPENLVTVGPVYDQNELAKYYSAADLSIITSKRETFSMPVAESLCCGTPIVGFKAGGPESIAIKEFSELFEQGDISGLTDAIVSDWINKKDQLGAENISSVAKNKYASDIMAKHYLSIYKELI